jgi:hypothetical protein
LRDTLITGGIAALTSALAAAACSRVENKRASPSINAISHIAWGGAPPRHCGPGAKNTVVGMALHTGASVFWATFFETIFGRVARRNPLAAWLGGAATSAGAYVTDYYIVSKRFRPGFEAYLSRPSLFSVYAALAAGFALGARLSARPRRQTPRAQRIERARVKTLPL